MVIIFISNFSLRGFFRDMTLSDVEGMNCSVIHNIERFSEILFQKVCLEKDK